MAVLEAVVGSDIRVEAVEIGQGKAGDDGNIHWLVEAGVAFKETDIVGQAEAVGLVAVGNEVGNENLDGR